jgi:NADH:ubiquinone oxidoreductase subunit 6 (subunit J)
VLAKHGIKIAIGGLVIYLTLAIIFMVVKDRTHSLMFLVGSLLWIADIFIWVRTKQDEGE